MLTEMQLGLDASTKILSKVSELYHWSACSITIAGDQES